MKEAMHLRTESLLPIDELLSDVSLPSTLGLHASGFGTDGDYLYSVRRAINSDIPLGATAEALYNGRLKTNGKQPLFQATEGHGLYAANHSDATKVIGVRGDMLYGLRTPLDNLKLLDSLGRHESPTTRAQRVAAALHRIRGVMPGIPNPGPSNWDKLYDDAEAVSFPPMAMARFCIGRTIKIDDSQLLPRWILLRDPANTQVISKSSAKKR